MANSVKDKIQKINLDFENRSGKNGTIKNKNKKKA